MEQFDTFSTTELHDFLNGPTDITNQEQKVALAPIHDILVELVKENKITQAEVDKYRIYLYDDNFSDDGIFHPEVYFEDIRDNLDELKSLREYDENSIGIISISEVPEKRTLYETEMIASLLCKSAAYEFEAYDGYDSTNLLFISTDTKAGHNIYKALWRKMMENKNVKEETDDNEQIGLFTYYVTYRIKHEQEYGLASDDFALVIQTHEPLSTAEAISAIIEQLGKKHSVPTADVFLYGFSFMGYDDLTDDPEVQDLQDKIDTQDTSDVYVYSIRYKQNDSNEVKEYEVAVNVDIESDASVKLELAESLVREQDTVSDDDYIEILEICKLGHGEM